MAHKYLVIVESPAKAKTIGKYLGRDYEVKACMGHLRDLPKSVLGVDVEHDFKPEYKPIHGKESLIGELKKAADGAEIVYLATDPDREGEAISWHLKELLHLSDSKARRVTFNEITKKVVQESITQPREIDQTLVDAQQARRVLDRVVGYKISPIMWKKIRRGLSAGRVQSVATRMVNEREKEIEGFTAEEYWTLDAELLQSGAAAAPFTAHYHGIGGKKQELPSEAAVAAVTEAVKDQVFVVKSVKRSDKQRSASPPFTTSSMQQEASRKLNMTPRRTMAIAQQLYEGVDIAGEGTVGLITYMRTDSLRISDEAMAAAKQFILGRYGAAYVPAQPRRFKAKSGAQDAHEAIRPSNVELTPEQLKSDLTPEQYRLYRLVWSRFVASQMANAVYDSVSVEIGAGEHDFRASASQLKFSGYTAVYEESRDDEREEKESALPALTEGEVVELKQFHPEQHFTQPPSRYTDATLIRAMEEQGIGRPSTYAPTVSTILDRNYVKKTGKYLCITNLGRAVTEWMERYFADIEDLKFTANMEQRLDAVEEGSVKWQDVLRDFYYGSGDHNFEGNLQKALDGDRIKVEDTVSEEVCPVCGRNLVERDGRFGIFLGCPGFPDCTFTMPLVEVMPGRCPKCGGRLMKRTGTSRSTGKQFTYYCCEFTKLNDPAAPCDFMTWDVPVKDECPTCGKTLFKRSGRGFKRPYCVNESCERFLPEEQRGYPKKKTEDGGEKKSSAKKAPAKTKEKAPAKSTAKKTTAKTAAKSTAKKAPAKTAEKKSTAKKAPAKSAEKKTAAKTATKKTTKKTAPDETGGQ